MSSEEGVIDNQDQGNSKKIREQLNLKKTQTENGFQRVFQVPIQNTETQQIEFKIAINSAKSQLTQLTYKHMDFVGDMIDFINQQFNEVKRSSPIYKYYLKIVFQILIYISTIMELIFTLYYDRYNEIIYILVYSELYSFSIFLTISIHICVQIYTYKYMNVQKNHLCWDLLNYFYCSILGSLSYLKLLPFLMFYTRDSSIQQFSFSQVNKFLIMGQIQKQMNPCGLFKKRNKPVNIFRDLIFHRIALISMMITFLTQSIPMLCIQGLFYYQTKIWSLFNVLNYFFLIVNTLYILTEYQFFVFTTTFRQITVDIQEKLHKIGIQKFQETKQLLKADESYFLNVKELYFQIDASKLNEYEKRRCIIQIIKFILKFRILDKIFISDIDSYEPITLQYLANALEFIETKEIILCHKNYDRVEELENTFKNHKNCEIVQAKNVNLETVNHMANSQKYWQLDRVGKTVNVKTRRTSNMNTRRTSNMNTRRTSNVIGQVTRRRNRRISKFFYLMIPDQLRQQVNFSGTLWRMLNVGGKEQLKQLQRLCSQNESQKQIQQQNEKIIQKQKEIKIQDEKEKFNYQIKNKIELYTKQIDKCCDCKEYKLKFSSICYILAKILMNLLFLVMQCLYFSQVEKDGLIQGIISLESLNLLVESIFLYIFFFKSFSNLCFCIYPLYFIFIVIFQFMQLWELVVAYVFIKRQQNSKQQQLCNSNTFIKFKNYTAKYKANIANVVFNYMKVKSSELDITSKPMYQAIKWRKSVSKAVYKIPEFYIYILTVNKDYAWGFSIVSTAIDFLFAVKDLQVVVVKDLFVPALILRKVSVDLFFQSMSILSLNQELILLEYPKSFAILSKLNRSDLNRRKYKIDFTQLDYFQPKPQAQLKLALVNINSSIEIVKAQEFLYFGEELISIFKCLQVSELQELKLNFQLDEIGPQDLWLLNIILQYCPKNKLQQLEIHVETKKAIYLKFNVERKNILTGFCYSYYQIREMIRQNRVQNAETIKIDKSFLQLDRYDFKQFYLEVGGFMDLTTCYSFFNQFTEVQTLDIALQSDSADQSFNLQQNIKSTKLTKLSLNLENIQLQTQGFNLMKLEEFKLTLINCYFYKLDLETLLLTMKSNGYIILDLRSQINEDFRFNNQEMVGIQQQLANKLVKIDFLL